MASLTFIMVNLAAVALLVLVPSISAYQTTAFVNEDSPRECQDQIQHRQLSYCQRFLTHGSRYIVLQTRLGVMDRPEQQLQECCAQLRQVDQSCRCKGLRHIVQEQARKGELPRKEMQKIVMKAETVPDMCGLGPQWCRIRTGGKY